jgi:hypothetical protein
MCPTDKLERYATLSNHHLLLCQERDPAYWEFYKTRAAQGDHLILDNGAYEGQKDWSVLRRRIVSAEPNVVVLPDYICLKWQETYFIARRFLDENFKTFPHVQWMYVPQAKQGDIIGWCFGLMTALEDPRITWVGLPRALAYLYTEDRFIRARIAEHLKLYHPHITIHALGMVMGDVDELNSLSACGCVESIDSHWPVKGKTETEILERLEVCGVNTISARPGN